VRVDNLVTAVRDGRKSFVREDRQCDTGEKPGRRCIINHTASCWFEGPAGGPQGRCREAKYSQNLDDGGELGDGTDQLIAGNVNQERDDDKVRATRLSLMIIENAISNALAPVIIVLP